MQEVRIRNVPDDTVARIDHLAGQANLNRSAYLRHLLDTHATNVAIMEKINQYQELINIVLNQLEKSNQVIENNQEVMTNFIQLMQEDL